MGGWPTWVCDGVVLQRAGASGVVDRAGVKVPGTAFMRWTIDDVHPGAYSVPDRLAMMDDQGVWAHVVYPNTVGFGGQRFATVADADLRRLAVEIYNDAMAEIQEESGGRLLPMGVLPSWDARGGPGRGRAHRPPAGCTASTPPPRRRTTVCPTWGPTTGTPCGRRQRGTGCPSTSTSGPATRPWSGSGPALAVPQRGVPSWAWARPCSTSTTPAVVANMIYAGVLERHPDLQLVTVESGVGWIPFLLAALDYQLAEIGAGGHRAPGALTPSDYFRRQFHACFWFEPAGMAEAAEALGWDRLMFETDYPHPTCIYPDALGYVAAVLADVGEEERRAVMGGNAARLYRVTPPSATSR